MGKKETKIAKAAHIKRHTEGTSNELSFSVLDAAKNRADAEEGKDGRAQVPKFGRISLFSLPIGRKKAIMTPAKENVLPLADGVHGSGQSGGSDAIGSASMMGSSLGSGASAAGAGFGGTVSVPSSMPYSSPEDEIVRRKTRRRRHRVLVTLIGIILATGLVGGGGYYLYSEMTKHREQVSLLDQSLGKITESDKVIVAMDQLINAPTDEVSADIISGIIEDIPETQQKLSEANTLATQSIAEMRESADKEAANQALAAIQARQEMLDLGQTLLTADLQVGSDTESIKTAWDLVLQADSTAREAAFLVTDTTNENVTASREKTIQAQQLFNEAHYQLEILAASPLAPDVQIMLDYVAKRAESMQYAILSDDAILIQDRQTAEAQNEAYNSADTEAAAMAKNLPSETTLPVIQAYETAIEDTRERYMQIRLKASTADAFLRDYLGNPS